MVEIQFLDYDIPNAIVPVISLNPDKVIYVYDPIDIEHDRLGRLADVLRKYIPNIDVVFCKVDRYAFHAIMTALRELVDELSDEEKAGGLVFDITGGTEVMTACGMILCHRVEGAKAVYTKTTTGELIDVYSNEKIGNVKHLTLDDYFTVSGTRKQGNSHLIPKEDIFPQIRNVAEWVFAHAKEWQALSRTLMNRYNVNGWFMLPEKISHNRNTYSTKELVKIFVQNGFLLQSQGRYKYANEAAKTYMLTYGIWLEMYTYIKAKECFSEVYLGCVIDWNSADGRNVVGSEIDVVAMKNSIIYFFSCKMAQPVQEDLCEVAYLAHLLGGDNAKGMLVTNYPFSERDKKNPSGIYTKMKDYKVGRILTEDLVKKNLWELL